jgi:hypothetical protein
MGDPKRRRDERGGDSVKRDRSMKATSTNLHYAESPGLRGSPPYPLNGQAIVAAPSLDDHEMLIDEALACW